MGPTIVEVTAHPRGGYRFVKWMGDGKAWINARGGGANDDPWSEVLGPSYDLNEDNEATKKTKIYIKMCNDDETEPRDRTLTAAFVYVPHPIGFELSYCKIGNEFELWVQYTYSSSSGNISDLSGGSIYEVLSNSMSDFPEDPIELMVLNDKNLLDPISIPPPFDTGKPVKRISKGGLNLPATIIVTDGFWDHHTPWDCRTDDIPGEFTNVQWYIYRPPGIELSDRRCHIVVGGPYKITHKFLESGRASPQIYSKQITMKDGCSLEASIDPVTFCSSKTE